MGSSDVNGSTTGPTASTISSSTVTFTPTVSTAQLTVIVQQGYVMAADLASGTETQAATCFQHATALWYCTNVVRTITDASQGHTDARAVYSSTTPPLLLTSPPPPSSTPPASASLSPPSTPPLPLRPPLPPPSATLAPSPAAPVALMPPTGPSRPLATPSTPTSALAPPRCSTRR